MSLFEKATRERLRFKTTKGDLSVEDLWLLPLESTVGAPNLDSIAQALDKEVKDSGTISFVKKKSVSNNLASIRFEIVKHIIDVRLAEDEARANEQERKQKKEFLLELISEKKQESLKGKSIEELTAMVNEI